MNCGLNSFNTPSHTPYPTLPLIKNPLLNSPRLDLSARLELAIPEMVFFPSLEFGSEDGFMELIEGIVDDAYKLSSLLPRIAKHNGMDHYQV